MIDVDEHEIAAFLAGLTGNNLSYDYVTIERPTLEDYSYRLQQKKGGVDELVPYLCIGAAQYYAYL